MNNLHETVVAFLDSPSFRQKRTNPPPGKDILARTS